MKMEELKKYLEREIEKAEEDIQRERRFKQWDNMRIFEMEKLTLQRVLTRIEI